MLTQNVWWKANRYPQRGKSDNKALAGRVNCHGILWNTRLRCLGVFLRPVAARFPLANLFQRHGYSTIPNYRSSLLGPWMRPDYYAQERSLPPVSFSLSPNKVFSGNRPLWKRVQFVENRLISFESRVMIYLRYKSF